jgi:hypothetical protein
MAQAQVAAAYFSQREARHARRHYQHFAFIINRLLNRLMAGLDEERAAAFKPLVFQTIHALHGLFNGREVSPQKPLFRAHKFVAPHFEYHGREENAGEFIARRLDALRAAERACGKVFILVTRGDGIKQELTSYEGHPLLDAAEWAYQQVRNSPDYAKNPAKAVTDELLDAAIARLPELAEDREASLDERQRAVMDAGDLMTDAMLKGLRTKLINSALSLLEKEQAAGRNPLLVSAQITDEIERHARRMWDEQCRTMERERRAAARSTIARADDGGGSGNNYVRQLFPLELEPEQPFEVVEHVTNGDALEEPTPRIHAGGGVPEVSENQPLIESAKSEIAEEPPPDMARAALWWAQHGIPVFPLHTPTAGGICSCAASRDCKSPGKHPRTARGLKDATTDKRQIKQWWHRWPDANIGGVTGAASGLLALDVDPKAGGDLSLTDLIEAHGQEWLDTFSVRTGSGGFHFFFKIPPDSDLRNTTGKIAPGLDTRANGGYIVLAPSLHAAGRRYRLVSHDEPRELSRWLLDTLAAPVRQTARVIDFQEKRPRAIDGGMIFSEGQRNDGLFRVACGLWGRGEAGSQSELHYQLSEVNRQRCVPPLPDSEVSQIAAHVAHDYPRGTSSA